MFRKRLFLTALVAAWLGAILAGQCWLLAYQNTPAPAPDAPADWPAASPLRPAAGRFTLLMFAHPHCPCTRQSLDELAWVLDRAPGRADARVLFVRPPGAPADWEQSPRWHQAQAIPGVSVHADADARTAADFAATTSGQVLLYDPHARLVFRGGITARRGHGGDNPGRQAVLAWLTDGAGTGAAPVFGCPLLGGEPAGGN